jgi:hypothetical protein
MARFMTAEYPTSQNSRRNQRQSDRGSADRIGHFRASGRIPELACSFAAIARSGRESLSLNA